jgi:hypothetical protein
LWLLAALWLARVLLLERALRSRFTGEA